MDAAQACAAHDGDERAFSQLVESHYRTVYALAFSAVGDWAAAEDVAQETFLVAWANLGRLRNPGAFGAWIRQIARNLSRNWRRSAGYRRQLKERQRQLARHAEHVEIAADTPVERSEQRSEVWAAIRTLSPRLREAVVLYYIKGNSVAETAVALGTTPNAVRKRLQHARPKLRAYFEARWKAEVERERKRLKSQEAPSRFLAAVPLGPVNAVLGKTAAHSGLGLWLRALGHGKLAAPVRAVIDTGAALSGPGKLAAAACAVAAVAGVSAVRHNANHATPPGTDGPMAIAMRQEDPDERPESVTDRVAADGQAQASIALASPLSAPQAMAVSSPPEPAEGQGMPRPKAIGQPSEFVSITGQVLDEEDCPIEGATVTICATGLAEPGPDITGEAQEQYRRAFWKAIANESQQYQAVTDTRGAFVVEGVAFEGIAVVKAEEGGHVLQKETLKLAAGGGPYTVTLRLQSGVPLEGRVLSVGGAPVADARVQVTALASVNGSTTGWGTSDWRWARADDRGVFRLVAPDYGVAVLFVESPTCGNAPFPDIPVEPGGFAELRYRASGNVYGRVLWGDGRPASGYTVRLRGRVEQPPYSSGGRGASPGLSYSGSIDELGNYRIDGVSSVQVYTASVAGPGRKAIAQHFPLGALTPGQELCWDHTIQEAAVVRGVVRGASSGKGIPGITVTCGRIDGTRQPLDTAETDASGAYEIKVLSGAGEHRVQTRYNSVGWPRSRFMSMAHQCLNAETVSLQPGIVAEQDFTIDDPWACSFLAVSAAGEPLSGVRMEAVERHERSSHRVPDAGKTDAAGRVRLERIAPGLEVTCEFSHVGYAWETSTAHAGEPGQDLPEEMIVLYRSSGIAGSLEDGHGTPIAGSRLELTVYYGQDGEKRLTLRTDATGAFEVKEDIPATEVVVELHVSVAANGSKTGLARSTEPFVCVAGQIVELGAVTMLPAGDPPAARE